ncbi:MAG: CCA tRNA nucleotidyltransferase [Candidatus Altiarchaeota archaeon]
MAVNLEEIAKRITPTAKEHEDEMRIVERIFNMLEEYHVKPILVGSLAKDTDLANNKDIDVFMQFPQDVSRDNLEKEGLRIGKEVFQKLGVEYEIDYAEHPYVKGMLGEHEIEIVPCYLDAKVMSSVDRTPHHTTYVKSKLDGNRLNSEIRLLKQFMRGIGVYGAEAKVEGFSGYLVELIVIRYGSFIKSLEAARSWKIPEVIDVESLWDDHDALPKFFTNTCLIVVDPVDRNRNVAAAVSPECLSKFIVKSDEFIRTPSEDYFFPKEKKMRGESQLKDALKSRKSKFIAFLFKHKKINVNTLYSQLRKTAKHVSSELEGLEFKVFRSSFWTNEEDASVILFEFQVWSLPELVHHKGPPITQDAVNQERFTQKYKDDRPYVKDGRWVVDTKRKYRVVADIMPDIISDKKGFGKNLRELGEAEVLEDEAVFRLKDPGWLKFLNEYMD